MFKDPGGWLNAAESAGPTGTIPKVMARIGLYPSGGHLVKRVIGVAGDVIECCDDQGRILVNGQPLDEKAYVRAGKGPKCNGPMVNQCSSDWTAGPVPEGHIFVMGDNRAHSADSTVHMCKPQAETDCVSGPEFVPRTSSWAGCSCCCGRASGSTGSLVRVRSRTYPTPPDPPDRLVPCLPSRTCPQAQRCAATPACTATSGRCAGSGSSPSPVSTRPVGARAPDRWWRARASCPTGKAGIVPGLADSKLLTEKARERVYAQVVRRAVAWSVVVIDSEECDRLGMHVANVEALRRAVALLDERPSYVLTDGFPVDGLEVPGLAVWKGDRVAACIAAASVLAKVTRDRMMVELDATYPVYDFKTHKGYITEVHSAALDEHGPSPVHRMRFVNVRRAAGLEPPLDVQNEQ